MLLDLRSLWEEQPAEQTSQNIGARGRRLKPPYTDAPGNPPRTYHQTGGRGWKKLTGTRRVQVQARAGARAGAATTCTVRLQPRPISPEIHPEGIKFIPFQPVTVIRTLREAPRFGTGMKSVRVLARVGGRCGAVTSAVKRIGRHQQEDEDLLLL